MSTYSREMTVLRSKAGDKVNALISEQGAYLAGGSITCTFSSERINDFDVYFRSMEQFEAGLATVAVDKRKFVTEAAVSFEDDGRRIQLIKARIGEPEQVISGFDFTICQAAFTGTQFLFGSDFFHHLAQRRLVFNVNSEFPLCSLYRARKFILRGYRFSGIDAIKLGLRIHALDLSTYAQLKRQLMGIDTMFLADLTAQLDSKAEAAYDFNEFLSLLEGWLEKLNALTGAEEREIA